ERRGLIDVAAASVRKRKRAVAAVLRDAIRIGEREERTYCPPSSTLPLKGEGSRLSLVSPPLRHRARIAGAARMIPLKRFNAMRQVHIVTAEASLGQHRREVG